MTVATYHKITPYAKDFANQLDSYGGELSLNFDKTHIDQLLAYLDSLLLWTKAYNLTAITDPTDAFNKHILDCLAVISHLPFVNQADIRLLDIGTGAGLPAVVIAIMKPDWQVTALDANSKKIRFVRQMMGELGLNNLVPVASRIEDFEGDYDVITSRAFASLQDFVSLASPYLNPQGVLFAMKGKIPSLQEQALGGWQVTAKPICVPNLSDERCVVYLSK